LELQVDQAKQARQSTIDTQRRGQLNVDATMYNPLSVWI